MEKKWYRSKTVWTNGLGGIAVIIQAATGQQWLDPEVQSAILVIANLVLRLFTKTGLVS